MYRIVPGDPGEQMVTDGTRGSPHKKKLGPEGRRMVMAGLLGCVLVLAAVIAWCHYSVSVLKAQLLKTESLDLKKDGYIIRNRHGAIIFTMTFR